MVNLFICNTCNKEIHSNKHMLLDCELSKDIWHDMLIHLGMLMIVFEEDFA